jgi:hypothetical protein
VPKGLKPVQRRLATGEVRIYWYHRATGKRLQEDPRTAAGLLEVRTLDERAKAASGALKAATGTIAGLWGEYRLSPEWRGLKPRTRSDYQAVRDWLGPAAEKAVLRAITTRQVIGLRDKAFSEKGRRFANYVVQVLRMLFGWGKLRGHLDSNPAAGVPSIRKPIGAPVVNRPWEADEIAAFALGCPFQILVPFALGLFASMRQGDALIVTRRAYDGGVLRFVAGKNGEAQVIPTTGVLKAILGPGRPAGQGQRRLAARPYRGRPALDRLGLPRIVLQAGQEATGRRRDPVGRHLPRPAPHYRDARPERRPQRKPGRRSDR